MSLRFVIESAPSPQAQTEWVFGGGQLSIGRSTDVDWQIDDPKMFISRKHCVIHEEGGQIVVTDTSSGGLYIDNAANAVGLGNSVPMTPGMRLHMGDFTLRVENATAPTSEPAPPQSPSERSGFFPPREKAAEPPGPAPARPADLPDPFGLRSDDIQPSRQREVERPPRPLDQTDPFGLDLRKPVVEKPATAQHSDKPSGGYFEPRSPAPESASRPPPRPPETKPDIFGDWRQPLTPAAPPAEPENNVPENVAPETDRAPPSVAPREVAQVPDDVPTPAPTSRVNPEPAQAPTDPAPQQPAAPVSQADADLRDALLRGMGLDPAQMKTDDPAAEMAHVGRAMRDLVEGVMLLLRTRAQEKQKVRVAQTIIASADVNPLKFLATPEDALSALIRPRGKGYMAPEAAVQGAFRDLADHQVRTWSALQVALRRMVDKFDPAEIAKEMEDVGLLESLVAGGRSAKLWQIYEDRYRDIAQTAEKQFLGDVGVDFRDAYENQRSD
jgi:type VI secretion system protein ImpI